MAKKISFRAILLALGGGLLSILGAIIGKWLRGLEPGSILDPDAINGHGENTAGKIVRDNNAAVERARSVERSNVDAVESAKSVLDGNKAATDSLDAAMDMLRHAPRT